MALPIVLPAQDTLVLPPYDLNVAFLEHCRDERGLSPLTIKSYAEAIYKFQVWLNRSLLTASREDVQRYMIASLKEVSGSSAHHRLSALRSFYRFMVCEGLLPRSPVRGLKTPHFVHKLPDWLNEKDTQKLLACAQSPRDALLLHLLYGSGLRVSEAASIRLCDIAGDLSTVTVMGKGGYERMVPISNRTQPILKEYLATLPAGEWLFPEGKTGGRKTGGHISRQMLWKIVASTAKRAKVTAHPHTLRHSAASHLTMNGAGVSEVQTFLGHASPETSVIYSHLDLKALRKVYDQTHPHAKGGRK